VDEPTAPLTWRPTADSFRYLAQFWAVLAVAAGGTVAARGGGPAVAVVAGSVVVVAALLTVGWGRRRVAAALEDPWQPALEGWPPTAAEWAGQLRAGRRKAAQAMALAATFGLLGGVVPVLGFGLAGADVGGAAGAVLLLRMVRRHEMEHGVLVLTAARSADGAGRRGPLVLGVVTPPPAVGRSHRPQ